MFSSMIPAATGGPLRCLWAPRMPSALRHASSSSAPPTPTPRQSQPVTNPHRAFYRTFGRPIAFVFLSALFTYQITYWAWLKLEAVETRKLMGDEIQQLESELATELLQRRERRRREGT